MVTNNINWAFLSNLEVPLEDRWCLATFHDLVLSPSVHDSTYFHTKLSWFRAPKIHLQWEQCLEMFARSKIFEQQQRRPMIARDCGKPAKMSKEEAERWRLIWVKAPLALAAITNNVAASLVAGKKPRVGSFSSGRERFWRWKGSELGRAWGGTDGLGSGELFLSAAYQPPQLLQPTWHAFLRQGEILVCLPISSNLLPRLFFLDW